MKIQVDPWTVAHQARKFAQKRIAVIIQISSKLVYREKLYSNIFGKISIRDYYIKHSSKVFPYLQRRELER